MHWYLFAINNETHEQTDGARFGVLTLDGTAIWTLDVPGEYDGLGEDWHWYYDLVEPGIQQTEVLDRSFQLRLFSLDSRISYRVLPDPDAEHGWATEEVDRVSDQLALSDGKTPLPEIELESLGIIELENVARDDAEITGIRSFAIDAAGRFGFVRLQRGICHFVVATNDGEVIAKIPFERSRELSLPVATPIDRTTWIVLQSTYEKGEPSRAWQFDTGSKRIVPIPDFECGRVESVGEVGRWN